MSLLEYRLICLDHSGQLRKRPTVSQLHCISGCDNASRKADVVFIHGLGGDAFGTWRSGGDTASSWPHWLAEEFPQVGVWSLGYAASPTGFTRFLGRFSKRWRDAGHSMALPDRAMQVLDLIVQRGLGERPLFFICHSLGGLLAKQILRKSVDAVDSRHPRVADNTRAVLFLATPHHGAQLASLANAFRAVFGTTVSIEDLRAHDAHLADLYDWYRAHAPDLEIQTETYFETRPVRGLLIVNRTSAHPGIGANPVAQDEDHLSIAKPRDRDAQVYGAARRLLRDYVLVQRPAPPAAPRLAASGVYAPSEARLDPAAAGVHERRIPHELPPPAEQFFGREEQLEKLTERLREGVDTAVVGPGGMGKTALAAAAVRAVVGKTQATLAVSPYSDGVVFLDLYAYRGQVDTAWNELASKLAGAGFMERMPAHDRATEACRGRRILIIVEGGEEADGLDGRATVPDLFSVLSPENHWLLLTRTGTQALPAQTVELKEALDAEDAARLFDSLTGGGVPAAARERVLNLVEGHPLALTWAGSLLARDDDDPDRLVADWQSENLAGLRDPVQAEHTLEWLFERSVRRLDGASRQVLAAAGLLARAPFPIEAMQAALGDEGAGNEGGVREALKALVHRSLLRRATEAGHWEFTHVLGYRFARKETGSDPEVRERLGRWLRADLEARLATGSLGGALEHAAALLRTDDSQRLWNALAKFMLYDATDRLVDLGRLGSVRVLLGAVTDWVERFYAERADDAFLCRERSVLLNRLGDVLRAQGDLAGALAAYRESLGLIRRLAEADPSNAHWQRDLSVSHSKVGDVLRAQGDLAGALAAYREALELSRLLAEADPSNTGRQLDVSICLERVGDVLRGQGDLAGALTAYRESLGLSHRLAETDPSNTDCQLHLSVSHNKMGHALRDQGDLAGALAAYQESLGLKRLLTEVDPSNAVWQRGLSYVLTLISQLHERQGELVLALPFAEESLDIDERLAALDRTNVMWQHDVAVSAALVARLRASLSG